MRERRRIQPGDSIRAVAIAQEFVQSLTSRAERPIPQRRLAMRVRFDPAAPYDVEESDTPFARPEGVELLARVYRPQGEPERPLAALVEVHGGAWSRLDRTTGAPHCRALAASGLLVVALDSRQGPNHKHPAAAADVAS